MYVFAEDMLLQFGLPQSGTLDCREPPKVQQSKTFECREAERQSPFAPSFFCSLTARRSQVRAFEAASCLKTYCSLAGALLVALMRESSKNLLTKRTPGMISQQNSRTKYHWLELGPEFPANILPALFPRAWESRSRESRCTAVVRNCLVWPQAVWPYGRMPHAGSYGAQWRARCARCVAPRWGSASLSEVGTAAGCGFGAGGYGTPGFDLLSCVAPGDNFV